MGVEQVFDTKLVLSYISFLRREGEGFIPLSIRKNIDSSQMSTPLLSWTYFNRNEAIASRLSELVDFDRSTEERRIGGYLIEQQCKKTFDREQSLYLKAYAIIETVWPEMAELIQAVDPLVSFPGSQHEFESASNPKIFGEIIYRMDSDCPVKWAEILVHEIGHHYLYVIMSTKSNSEVFKRPFKDVRYSNLKSQKRPLVGIYHAVFAQSCMITLASRILELENDDSLRNAAKKILGKFKDIFPKDLETILETGLLDFDQHIKSFILEAQDRFLRYFSPSERSL